MVPQHIWQSRNFTTDLNFAQDVTDGPYYHLAYSNGSSTLTLKANPYYWNPAKIPEIDIQFVGESNQSALAGMLLTNQTDIAQIAPGWVSQFTANPDIDLLSEPDRSILYLEYNITEYLFNDTSFRQALAEAINTTQISQSVYSGYATPGILGEGTIPPSATAWHNPSDVQYNFNLSSSENSPARAGFTISSGGALDYPNGTQVGFTIYTDTDTPSDVLAAAFVANDLSQLGMNITVVNETRSQIVSAYDDTNVQNELIVMSSSTPVFGIAPIDIRPGFQVYFPWHAAPTNWLLPFSAETQFEQESVIVNSSTDLSVVQKAVQQIDLINSQYLPVIVLAYPDELWAYRSSAISGVLPVSLDFGGNTLRSLRFQSAFFM